LRWFLKYFLCGLVLIYICPMVLAQNKSEMEKIKTQRMDTIQVAAGDLIILKDTLLMFDTDTTLVLPAVSKVKIRKNPYSKSDKFYDSLESKFYRNLVTRELHKLLIRRSKTELSDTVNIIKSETPFLPYEGKTIRKIYFKKVDILEGSVLDTTLTVETGIGRVANSLHTNTLDPVLRKNLLFREGEPLSAFILADNERILRELLYIQDVRIIVLPDLENSELVDIYVITQDNFSIRLGGGFGDPDDFELRIGERNILGSGKELTFSYILNNEENPSSGYGLEYRDPNIAGTFISNRVILNNFWDQEGFEVDFNRNFITPQTKWAGGLDFGSFSQVRRLRGEPDSTIMDFPYESNFQDFWLGRAFQLGQSSRKNISITGRIFRENFTDRPFVSIDSNQFFHDNVLLIGGVSFTNRNFLKSSMIQAFGVTEDIPRGYVVDLNYGFEFGEFKGRPYWGFKMGAGDFLKDWGYFATIVEFGGFVEDNRFKEGAISTTGIYFSPLLNVGRFKFRQFLNAVYVVGLNREIETEINFENEIRGINEYLRGNRKLAFRLEPVFFNPFYFYGFQMATFFFYDFGWISFDKPLVTSVNFHSSIGIGLRLRNESLLFKTIQISLGYLPQDESFGLDFSLSDPLLFQNFRESKPTVVDFGLENNRDSGPDNR